MPQRVIVIHSPHSGRSSKLPDAIKHLEQAGLEVVNSISIAKLDNLPAQGTPWKPNLTRYRQELFPKSRPSSHTP